MRLTALLLGLVVIAGCAGTRAIRAQQAGGRTMVTPPPSGDAPDPLTTDPDKYSLVLENEHVRVLRYHDRPGAKTRPHHHRQFVLVVLAPFRRRLTFPDGQAKERDFEAGETIWMPEQTHTGENIGSTNTDVLLIEVK
jgi:hypothetical protein